MEAIKLGSVGLVLAFIGCCLMMFGGLPLQVFGQTAPGRVMAKQATKTKELWITSDHSKHKILQQEFKSGPEVTRACLTCHSEAAKQFQQTIHWTWMDPSTEASVRLGKGGLSVNNF